MRCRGPQSPLRSNEHADLEAAIDRTRTPSPHGDRCGGCKRATKRKQNDVIRDVADQISAAASLLPRRGAAAPSSSVDSGCGRGRAAGRSHRRRGLGLGGRSAAALGLLLGAAARRRRRGRELRQGGADRERDLRPLKLPHVDRAVAVDLRQRRKAAQLPSCRTPSACQRPATRTWKWPLSQPLLRMEAVLPSTRTHLPLGSLGA